MKTRKLILFLTKEAGGTKVEIPGVKDQYVYEIMNYHIPRAKGFCIGRQSFAPGVVFHATYEKEK